MFQGFGYARIEFGHLGDDWPVKSHVCIHHPLLIAGEKPFQMLHKGYGKTLCHFGRFRPRYAQRIGGLAQQM